MNVADIVRHYGLWHSDRPAVVCGAKRLTYGQLADRTKGLASALASHGIERNSRVAVLSTNSAEYVEVVYALAELGAIWVPINFRLAPAEIEFILRDSGAKILLHSPDLDAVAGVLRETLRGAMPFLALGGGVDGPYEDLIRRGMVARRAQAAHSDDPFAIMYTSGTTGHPKGVLLTHRQFLSGTYYLSAAVGAAPHDRKLQAIPQFHAGGAIYQMAYMLAGATIVVLPAFDPGQAIGLLRDEDITVAGFVPAMLTALCEHLGGRTVSAPRLRQVMYGGSSITAALLSRAMETFPVDFIQTYGQTEAGVIVTILDAESHRRAKAGNDGQLLRSCGRPLLGYDVKLLDRDECDADRGELCVRSDALMTGYWNRPEATAAAIVDGWLRTGDVATRDREGFYYIVDRKVDVIISGGENVYALEVENVLAEHPDIAEVAVIGVPDPRWGEAVLAVVTPRSGRMITFDQVRGHCRGRLAGFKAPKRVEFIEKLPRNASGKVLKHVLRSRFSQSCNEAE